MTSLAASYGLKTLVMISQYLPCGTESPAHRDGTADIRKAPKKGHLQSLPTVHHPEIGILSSPEVHFIL